MPAKVNIGVELEHINTLIGTIKTELQGKATAEKLDELAAEIRLKDRKIELLESRIAILEKKVLAQKSDDNEQYSRRSSLRINNIPLPEGNKKETSENVSMKVKEVIAESATIIPDIALDRAH